MLIDLNNRGLQDILIACVDGLKKHLLAYLLAYNFQRPLKELKYMSPYDKMIEIYEEKAELFRLDPPRRLWD